MTDKRFEDRLKRINKRATHGARAEMIAGVGNVAQAQRQAAGNSFPLLSMLLGGLSGYGALYILNDRLGLDAALALIDTPQDAVTLAQSDMTLGGAGAGLAVIALLFVFALAKGYKAPKLHAFSFAAMAGACAAAAVIVAQPDVLRALLAPYI